MACGRGTLEGAARNDRRFWILWQQIVDIPIVVPAPVLAQVWRGPQSQPLARVLRACAIEPVDERLARMAGEAFGRSQTTDIADAVVVVGAADRGDDIISTDLLGIRRLTASVPLRGRVLDFNALRL